MAVSMKRTERDFETPAPKKYKDNSTEERKLNLSDSQSSNLVPEAKKKLGASEEAVEQQISSSILLSGRHSEPENENMKDVKAVDA